MNLTDVVVYYKEARGSLAFLLIQTWHSHTSELSVQMLKTENTNMSITSNEYF